VKDVAIAGRALRRTPAFTLFVVAIISLATCAVATVSAFVTGLRPSYAYGDSPAETGRIVAVYGPQESRGQIAIPDLIALRNHHSLFSELTGWTRATVDWVPTSDAELAFIEVVTGDYFSFLSVRAEHGRTLLPGDDDANSLPVALLSQKVWRHRFGADPAVVGRSLRIGNGMVRVVGVMPPEYNRPGVGAILPAPLWMTYAGYEALGRPRLRRPAFAYALAKLRPGLTVPQAQKELSRIASSCCEHLGARPDLSIEKEGIIALGPSATSAAIYLAAAAETIVLVVLITACVNVGSLFTGRIIARRGDIVARVALGASPWAAVRVPFIECALLILCGSATGVGLGAVLLKSFRVSVPVPMGATFELQPNVDTVLVAVVVFVAVMAAVVTAGGVVAIVVRRESLTSGQLRPMWRWQRRFAVFQIALSSAVIVGAVSVADALRSKARATESFDLEHLVLAGPDPRLEQDRVTAVFADVVNRIQQQPTIRRTAVLSGVPGVVGSTPTIRVETGESDLTRSAYLRSIACSETAISTLGLRILAGRDFYPGETDSAILTVRAASSLFGQGTAVGASVRLFVPGHPVTETLTVIGIVQEFGKRPVDRGPRGTVFIPLKLATVPSILAASVQEPKVGIGIVRDAFRQSDPQLALAFVRSGRELQELETYVSRLALRFTTGAAAFATFLAFVGLYALLVCLGISRRRELGIRAALGAPSRALATVVLGDTAKVIIPASFIGTCVGWYLTVFLSRSGMSTFGEIGFVAAVGVWLMLMTAALIASWNSVRQAIHSAPASIVNAQ
jgi:putative ABC transport system permease protein